MKICECGKNAPCPDVAEAEIDRIVATLLLDDAAVRA